MMRILTWTSFMLQYRTVLRNLGPGQKTFQWHTIIPSCATISTPRLTSPLHPPLPCAQTEQSVSTEELHSCTVLYWNGCTELYCNVCTVLNCHCVALYLGPTQKGFHWRPTLFQTTFIAPASSSSLSTLLLLATRAPLSFNSCQPGCSRSSQPGTSLDLPVIGCEPSAP